MNRVLLFVLTIGLSAGQALGGLYVLDKPTAMSFVKISASEFDIPTFPAEGSLNLVAANPSAAYGPMQLAVGFAGALGDGADADNTASITIGKTDLELTGYEGFATSLANDNDDPWGVQLYLVDDVGKQTSSSVVLVPGTSTWLSVPLSQGATTIKELGLIVESTFVPAVHPSNPDYYHVSAVPMPLPGAALLGMLGLAAAGLRLRRSV